MNGTTESEKPASQPESSQSANSEMPAKQEQDNSQQPEKETNKQKDKRQKKDDEKYNSQQPEKETNKQKDKGEKKDDEKYDKKDDKKEEKQPAGGYDSTPIPKAPPGWTIKITFHRATNLPMADINTLSSDPYVLAQLNTSLPQRHKEDPELRMRTPTIPRNTDPTWDFEWIVANVPSSGFKLKARVYDEDPADHDDRLGNAHIYVDRLSESWPEIKNQPYKIMKRAGSKRAYLVRAVATCFNRAKHMNGDLYVSVELLGRTKDENGGRAYTAGPCWWTRHYSPMLGRIANRKEPDDEEQDKNLSNSQKKKKKAERYNFQANQFQLQGPVPAELYHRYVEFKAFVKGMFTHSGPRGYLLSKALHHQHARVYNFDRSTEWGIYKDGPSEQMTQKFLDLVHHDQGGRIFTYVLTLDALFRFTETGKEFGIDMLSKHTMHSDVSIYIAFSGEFFVRRLKHKNRPPPPEPAEETSQSHPFEEKGGVNNASHPPDDIDGGPPSEEAPRDPKYYELIIDNDSGTYRPNAKLLPLLRQFLSHSLPGLHIQVLDCNADKERMDKWKQEQRDRKKKEGDNIVYKQGSRNSSISSSDEEDLDSIEGGGAAGDGGLRSIGKSLGHDYAGKGKAHIAHFKGGHGDDTAADDSTQLDRAGGSAAKKEEKQPEQEDEGQTIGGGPRVQK